MNNYNCYTVVALDSTSYFKDLKEKENQVFSLFWYNEKIYEEKGVKKYLLHPIINLYNESILDNEIIGYYNRDRVLVRHILDIDRKVDVNYVQNKQVKLITFKNNSDKIYKNEVINLCRDISYEDIINIIENKQKYESKMNNG